MWKHVGRGEKDVIDSKCSTKKAKIEINHTENEIEDFRPSKLRQPSSFRSKRSTEHSNKQDSLSDLGRFAESTRVEDQTHFEEETLHCNDGNGLRFCPICQFPFDNLVGQSGEWHVSDCLASHGDTSNRGECPRGLNCAAVSQEHYRRYLHTEQAEMRSNCKKSTNDSSTIAVADQDTCDANDVIDEQARHGNDCSINEICPVASMAEKAPCIIMETSSDSLENLDFSDEGYEQVLSEIVDELGNDHIIASSSQSTETDSNDIASSDADLSINRGIPASKISNTPNDRLCKELGIDSMQEWKSADIGKGAATSDGFLSVVDMPSRPQSLSQTEGKKLQQMNLSSYFGTKAKSSSSTKRPESKVDMNVNNPSGIKTSKADNHKSYNQAQRYRKVKSCPFYKKIPGTSITVDAFSYGNIPGCTAYFLSHFHYDHYGGLTKAFANKMFCSKVTASLVQTQIKVNSKYIQSLPMNKEIFVEDVKVILLDANHCPGSVMFLFLLPNGRTILHTGDFRAETSMVEYSHLQNITVDTIFLDTTYCNPSYNFPTQQRAIDFAVGISRSAVQSKPRTLIVCGTYSVGKERVFVSIAKALDCKICATTTKRRILDCLEWPELTNRLTAKWNLAQVHVVSMNQINVKSLKNHLLANGQFQEVLAFKPTGWTYKGSHDLQKVRPTVSGPVTIYGVPYSEHSSFSELEWFVKQFRPGRIIPTVNNGSPASRSKMQDIFAKWLAVK